MLATTSLSVLFCLCDGDVSELNSMAVTTPLKYPGIVVWTAVFFTVYATFLVLVSYLSFLKVFLFFSSLKRFADLPFLRNLPPFYVTVGVCRVQVRGIESSLLSCEAEQVPQLS